MKIGEIEKKYSLLFEELRKSEQEKAVILDAMTELVLFLDTELKVIWANKAMHEAFRLKPGELNGKHCYRALHGRSRACSICPAEKTLRTGKPHDVVDISSYKKNWVLRSYPVCDEKGSLSGVVEIVTDITERRRAEEAMRFSEQKYRELFENANDIIFILDFKERTTKEMAKLLNAPARTVEVHRDNIRKKLRLRNRKANLKSYRMAL